MFCMPVKETHKYKVFSQTVWHRILDLRVKLHRPFILLKQGIPETERLRHLKGM